ncbi:MAG TPA: hypothetical protein VHO25_09170 [Polyangiaceae bacterium]|nr:hypothetical protein [Polyangiaceae bacterium]
MTLWHQFILWWASKLPMRAYGSESGTYLERYVRRDNDPKSEEEVRRFTWNSYLHRFCRSDEDLDLHNHPWRWGFGIILWGGYIEERLMPDGSIRVKRFGPGAFNFVTRNTFHRVDLIRHECWTLFWTAPKQFDWGFWNRETRVFTEFKARLRQRGLEPREE